MSLWLANYLVSCSCSFMNCSAMASAMASSTVSAMASATNSAASATPGRVRDCAAGHRVPGEWDIQRLNP